MYSSTYYQSIYLNLGKFRFLAGPIFRTNSLLLKKQLRTIEFGLLAAFIKSRVTVVVSGFLWRSWASCG